MFVWNSDFTEHLGFYLETVPGESCCMWSQGCFIECLQKTSWWYVSFPVLCGTLSLTWIYPSFFYCVSPTTLIAMALWLSALGGQWIHPLWSLWVHHSLSLFLETANDCRYLVCFMEGEGRAGGRCILAFPLGSMELLPPEPISISGCHRYKQLCPPLPCWKEQRFEDAGPGLQTRRGLWHLSPHQWTYFSF